MRTLSLALALLFLTHPGRASCLQELSEAARLYRSGDFPAAIQQASDQLANPRCSNADHVQAYRLITLAHLHLDQLPDASRTILELLDTYPRYDPDPILDPPDYVALVRLVKERLGSHRIQRIFPVSARAQRPASSKRLLLSFPPIPPMPPPPPPPPVRLPGWQFEALALAGSYGGERGVTVTEPLSSWSRNAGPGLGLNILRVLSSNWQVGLLYRAQRAPTLLHWHASDLEGDPLVPRRSSDWIHHGGLTLRLTLDLQQVADLYLQGGASLAATRLNDEIGFAGGPVGAIGLALPVLPRTALFVEAGGALYFPGDAIDRASSMGYDPLSWIGVGTRLSL